MLAWHLELSELPIGLSPHTFSPHKSLPLQGGTNSWAILCGCNYWVLPLQVSLSPKRKSIPSAQDQSAWTALDSPWTSTGWKRMCKVHWLKTSASFVLWAKGWWEAVPKKIDMLNLKVILPASSLDTMYTWRTQGWPVTKPQPECLSDCLHVI